MGNNAMSKHGAIVGGLAAILATAGLSACHVHDHSGGTVYRPYYHTVRTGPVETRTTTVRPYYGGYRYMRYRRDRHGRYYRDPHGNYYLAHDGRYYPHRDIRYSRDRYGRFHQDRRGQYYLAHDGRYYGVQDGRYSEDRGQRHERASAVREPAPSFRANRANPPAHGRYGTQPGHLRREADTKTMVGNVGNVTDKANGGLRYGTLGQPPINPSGDLPTRQSGQGRAPASPPANTASQRLDKRFPPAKQPTMSSHPGHVSGKPQAKAGNSNPLRNAKGNDKGKIRGKGMDKSKEQPESRKSGKDAS